MADKAKDISKKLQSNIDTTFKIGGPEQDPRAYLYDFSLSSAAFIEWVCRNLTQNDLTMIQEFLARYIAVVSADEMRQRVFENKEVSPVCEYKMQGVVDVIVHVRKRLLKELTNEKKR